jgi:intron-binding protein aquarius
MPPKRSRKAVPKGAAAKRSKTKEKPSVQDLAKNCLEAEDTSARVTALQEAVDKGYRKSIVWPEMCVMHAKGKKRKQDEWLQISLLGATLLSWEFREGSPKHNIAPELGDDDKCTIAWLETLCNNSLDNFEYNTTVVHVLDILLASLPSSSPLHATMMEQLGGPIIYHFLPPHRKELEDRKGKFTVPESSIEKHPPFLVRMIEKLVQELCHNQTVDESMEDDEEANSPDNKDLFVHRCFELLIDVLSIWESRKYLVPYLEATHFHIKCPRAVANSSSVLVKQLLESVKVLLKFPLDPYNGNPQTRAESLALYHRRASTLQKMAHRYYNDKAPDIIYSGIGILCSDKVFLRRSLAGLSDIELCDFLSKMKLIGENEKSYDRNFLLDVLEDFLLLPTDPLETLKNEPLYPTELVLWDNNRIPPSRRSRESKTSPVLSLPKLHQSFLSFSDYLVRNFTLTRLETAYSIRTDLVDVIRRLNPVLRHIMNEDDENEDTDAISFRTEFSGWARMALELDKPVDIIKVEKPLLGTNYPSSVKAVIKIDLKSCAEGLQREWDSLAEFDNLFLVSINAAKMSEEDATQDGGRSMSDDDDPSFPHRYGVTAVRGCMITHIKDEQENVINEPGAPDAIGTKRFFHVLLDPHQFALDTKSKSGTDLYQTMNIVVRRQGRENNFRAILETTRGLLSGNAAISRVVPSWLQPVLLGRADPKSAAYDSHNVRDYAEKTVGVANPDSFLDFGDAFVDEAHLLESFPGSQVNVDGKKCTGKSKSRCNYKVKFQHSKGKSIVDAQSYEFAGKGNQVRFTPVQIEAIRSGLSCGLTTVVGPPGTGKTDLATQVIACLYHSYPTQRTVVITHSNAALNDIFSKVMARGDVDERYMVRLGAGERDLEIESSHDFTKAGRVSYSLNRRAELLEHVQRLSESLGLSGKAERGADGSPSYTCETAAIFYENHVRHRLRIFEEEMEKENLTGNDTDVTGIYPFRSYFGAASVSREVALELSTQISGIFEELAEYYPLELLRSQRQKTDYLLIKQARVVAMTCTHAAIARSHLLDLGFEYDNLVIEESGQMTENDTIIPFLLQKSESDSSGVGSSRLKRVCLLGDHHQLPPVIKNQTFSRYSNLDQSLFGRLIKFGVPVIQLDRQGRARSDLARFYQWRYSGLGNLSHVETSPRFQVANAGFAHAFQFIQVDDYRGKGETTPTPYFYQNIGEAEYIVALFQYMVLIGYEPDRISILATYNGQKELIRDIISQRCGEGTPLEGVRPAAVSTVDQFQGQQNDYILLSLVRTESLGHLRDIRRWVVALSRARLGLYIFGRSELYKSVHDLQPFVQVWEEKPHQLELVVGETFGDTERSAQDSVPKNELLQVENVDQLGGMVYRMQEQLLEQMDEGEAETEKG